jgi:hypothetical protein
MRHCDGGAGEQKSEPRTPPPPRRPRAEDLGSRSIHTQDEAGAPLFAAAADDAAKAAAPDSRQPKLLGLQTYSYTTPVVRSGASLHADEHKALGGGRRRSQRRKTSLPWSPLLWRRWGEELASSDLCDDPVKYRVFGCGHKVCLHVAQSNSPARLLL